MDPVIAFHSSDSYKYAMVETAYAIAESANLNRTKPTQDVFMQAGNYFVTKFCANSHHDKLSSEVLNTVCKEGILDPWTTDIVHGMSMRFFQGQGSSRNSVGSSPHPASKHSATKPGPITNGSNSNAVSKHPTSSGSMSGHTSRNGNKSGSNSNVNSAQTPTRVVNRSSMVSNLAKKAENNARKKMLNREEETALEQKKLVKQNMLQKDVGHLADMLLKNTADKRIASWFRDNKGAAIREGHTLNILLPRERELPATAQVMKDFKELCHGIPKEKDPKEMEQTIKNIVSKYGLYTLGEVQLAIELTCLYKDISVEQWLGNGLSQQYKQTGAVVHPDKLVPIFLQHAKTKDINKEKRFYFMSHGDRRLNIIEAAPFKETMVYTWAYYENKRTVSKNVSKDEAKEMLSPYFTNIWTVASNVLQLAIDMFSIYKTC